MENPNGPISAEQAADLKKAAAMDAGEFATAPPHAKGTGRQRTMLRGHGSPAGSPPTQAGGPDHPVLSPHFHPDAQDSDGHAELPSS